MSSMMNSEPNQVANLSSFHAALVIPKNMLNYEVLYTIFNMLSFYKELLAMPCPKCEPERSHIAGYSIN